MPSSKPLLVCIVGPTAIGKTTLSIEIAQSFSTEIISADSRQFFKEMKIGTAVPSEDELDTIPHHFIQNKSIFENYSVGDFEKEALETLRSLFKKFEKLVLVGGSGLYVDAVVKGLDKFPEVPKEIREQLNYEFETKGISSLQVELKEKDPSYYEVVDVQNPHRLIRALEVFRATGQTFSSFRLQNKPQRNFNSLLIGLTADREIIYDRINKRVDMMIEHGLIEEAKALFEHRNLNALQTVGYRELFRYFEGGLHLDQAISEIKKNTRRFAKRQETWFKKNAEINWFEYQTTPSEIVEFIKQKSAQK